MKYADLSHDLVDVARDTAFVLMRANYSVIRASEVPGGKLRGLRNQESQLAIRIRESILHRFDALVFHRHLVEKYYDGAVEELKRRGPHPSGHYELVYASVHRLQMLFDSLVFHSVSLFDYLGNSVWFGFHGSNHVKKKWKGAYGAAKTGKDERDIKRDLMIQGSETGKVVLEEHDGFVRDLRDYRAALFHYGSDDPRGGLSQSFSSSGWQPHLHAFLPADYVAGVRSLVGDDKGDGDDMLLVDGADGLVQRVGQSAIRVLRTLSSDLDFDPGGSIVSFAP